MTAVSDIDLPVPTPSRPVLGGTMILLLLVSFGSFTGFYLLLSVIPLYAAAGGAGAGGAGAATGVMMLATVLAELAVARLVARFGNRVAACAGLLALAVSAIALTASERMPLIIAVCVLRGAGLAVVAVVGPTLTAELVPAERRSGFLGLYGVAVGVPAVIGLPLGVWLSGHLGFRSVFLISAAVSVATLIAALGLPARRGRDADHGAGVLGGLRQRGLARPTMVFAAFTVAAGVSATFLSLAMPAKVHAWVPVALLAQTVFSPLSRWWAGRLGDRRGSGLLLVPAVCLASAGIAGLVWVRNPVAVIAGMALFGIGFGIGQNVTLALMLERVSAHEFGTASALWNLAYDGGFGIGAVGFGLLAGPVGYPAGFALVAVLLALAVIPAWRDRGEENRGAEKENRA